ncbi:TPA: transferrin-binding protein-like solute binding protein [Haemophilus influenzae]
MKSVPLISGGLSLLLSACSAGGGGSFDVDNVSNIPSSKPHYQDDTSNQRTKSNLEQLSIPSLGGGMKLVAQNFIGDKEPSLLNENNYISFLTSLSMIKDDVEKENKYHTNPIGSIDEPNTALQGSNLQKYVYSGLYYIDNWKDFSKAKEKKAYSGYYGYAFYYGNQTATNLPVNGVAKYKGTWNFITATENGKSYSLLSNSRQAYSRRSAIPADIDLENNPNNGETGLTSEFTVNFGTKKLTGELYYHLRKTNTNELQNRKHKLYDLKAEVYSNRFRGNVIPIESTSEEHPFTSEGVLEGGFYGSDGEELGGKFLADDKRVFGVFSAKETPENQTLSKETLIDGKLTTFSTKTTDETNFITKDIPSFGEADYLLIDNYPIPLLPENSGDFISSKHHNVGNKTYKVEACCNNLNYVKFGMYYEDKSTKDNTNKTDRYHQFLLGHRTTNIEIPNKGSAKYHGSWFGYITDGTTSYSTTGDKQRDKSGVSDFDVNFDNKTLKGELKRADTQNTVFNIDATFKNSGNAFTGTATAKDLVIDGKNSQTQNAKINITTDVNGAFYGPHASELGGYFTYNGKDTTTKNIANSADILSANSENARAAVVFGAKQQVETTK